MSGIDLEFACFPANDLHDNAGLPAAQLWAVVMIASWDASLRLAMVPGIFSPGSSPSPIVDFMPGHAKSTN